MIHMEKANVKWPGPSVARMCELLEVSRSGYYDWAARQTAGPGSRETRLLELAGKITAAPRGLRWRVRRAADHR
jgi:hypothetical protein